MNPYDEDEDPWPDEPKEFDPHSLGPSVRIPGVDTESSSDVPTDVPAEVANAFWATVVMVNVGILGLSVGAMFVGFRADWDIGGPLMAIGGLALLLAYRRYDAYMNRDA